MTKVIIALEEYLQSKGTGVRRYRSILDPFRKDIAKAVTMNVPEKLIREWLAANNVKTSQQNLNSYIKRHIIETVDVKEKNRDQRSLQTKAPAFEGNNQDDKSPPTLNTNGFSGPSTDALDSMIAAAKEPQRFLKKDQTHKE